MNHRLLKDTLCAIGLSISRHVHSSLIHQSLESRTSVHSESADDTIYQIDRDVEPLIVPYLESSAGELGGIILIAEGMGDGRPLVFPKGTDSRNAAWRLLIDPIDGTRGIMYDKRSAFFLAGAAPNRGEVTCLQDIEIAVMVEIPTSRSDKSDTFWTIRGEGVFRFTRDLVTQETVDRPIQPTKSKTILGGFAQIARFFPPGRDILAKMEEELIETLFPKAPPGRAILFEDQYISTGGQLNEILLGHDRFIADIRGGLYKRLAREGKKSGLVCHPYDVSAHLIGTEAGIFITGIDGSPLNAPMDTTSPIDWIAYANQDIRSEVEPVLNFLLKKYEIL